MWSRTSRRALGIALLVSALVAWSLSLGGPAAAAAGKPGVRPHLLPVGTVWTGIDAWLANPATMPPGSDNWSCHPSAAHPYPVILVHGTFASEDISWAALSPMLANAGYCVYAYDYGHTTAGPFYGMAEIGTSAHVLASFVAKVLKSTRAKQVDIVGHSEGGMMPRYYIRFLGGARLVHVLVGLAPSNHGTTLWGFSNLVQDFQELGLPTPATFGCVACNEQLAGSAFLDHLNAGADTVAGPLYVVIESQYDEVVTPYTSAFLTGPNVQNIDLQSQCSDDFSDHLGIIYDLNALADVMNVLGPDKAGFVPPCVPTLPVVGG